LTPIKGVWELSLTVPFIFPFWEKEKVMDNRSKHNVSRFFIYFYLDLLLIIFGEQNYILQFISQKLFRIILNNCFQRIDFQQKTRQILTKEESK